MFTYWRLVKQSDFEELLNLKLREADTLELQASLGVTGPLAIAECLIHSERTWVGIDDGDIICVFGLGAVPPDVGIPWMLGTEGIDKVALTFLKESREIVKLMLDYYPYLTNLVDARHTKAIRWLKWLGFSFDSEPWYQLDPDVPFLKFFMIR